MSASGINKVKVVVVPERVLWQVLCLILQRPCFRVSSAISNGEQLSFAVEVDGVFAFKARIGRRVKEGGWDGWVVAPEDFLDSTKGCQWTIAYDPDVLTIENGELK